MSPSTHCAAEGEDAAGFDTDFGGIIKNNGNGIAVNGELGIKNFELGILS